MKKEEQSASDRVSEWQSRLLLIMKRQADLLYCMNTNIPGMNRTGMNMNVDGMKVCDDYFLD